MANVAFIGLGVMGSPMARHLSTKGGHHVTVYNRTQVKSEEWVAKNGGRLASTPAAAAQEAEFVFCCVGNDDDLRQVTLGDDGIFKTLQSDAVFIDHTTASASIARELYQEAIQRRAHALDAPVTGGQAGAESGILSVIVGGDQAPYERARPVIECFGRKIDLMGPSGAGQLSKMVNQICIAGLLQGLAEGVNFAQRAGLNVEQLVEVISHGAAGSWQMSNRHATMTKGEYDFGFAVDWMRKDLAICLDEAERNGASLPVTALVDQFYKDVQAANGGRWDTSSLLTRLTD